MKIFRLLSFILFLPMVGVANNIQVENARLVGATSTTTQVAFDLSWENSWRTSSGAPNNWDAAWVFIKYRVGGSDPWLHATLTANNVGHNNGEGTEATISVPSDKKGAFIYRSQDGSGAFSLTNAQLRWDFSLDGVVRPSTVDIKVFAIEMVYIPTGDFWVGDGLSNTNNISGYAANTSGNSLFVNANDIVPTVSCCFANPDREVQNLSSPLVGYPNGHRAMYSMKYPITQFQYVDFLNTLPREDQSLRVLTTTVGNFMHSTGTATSPQFRNGIRLIQDPGGTASRVYACDLTPSGSPFTDVNQENDGLHIAVNFINMFDLSAYLFWSALRPMTVMEFEKIARGPGVNGTPPTPAEYVWGNTNAPSYVTVALDDANTPTEGCATSCGNQIGDYFANNASKLAGPVRVGALATNTTDREASGAGFYGVMNMGDNVHDLCINLYDAGSQLNNSNGGGGGRHFRFNQHGTGNISNYEDQNEFTWNYGWPLYNFESNSTVYRAASVKGSCFGHGAARRQISRHDIFDDGTGDFSTETRQSYYGGRGVRTAPTP